MAATSADSATASRARGRRALAVGLASLFAATAGSAPRASSGYPGAPCLSASECVQAEGEFCLGSICRAAEDLTVEPLFRVAVAPFFDLVPDGHGRGLADKGAATLAGLLRSTVYFDTLDPDHAPEGAAGEGWQLSTVRLDEWSRRGAFGLIKGVLRVSEGPFPFELELHFIETETARRIPMPSDRQGVTAGTIRRALQRWSDEVVQAYTGRPGILSTRLAYARRPNQPGAPKEIFVATLDGIDVTQVTNNASINVLPAWDPRGRVAYTSYKDGVPSVYVDEQLFAGHGSLNTGISWRPGGGDVAALSMSGDDGNSDIYLVDGRTGALIDRLTHSSGIDTSPSWSPDGRRIAFVSDRAGGPQIWVMDSDGGSPRSLTPWCGYCTSPDWSPTSRWIAYTAMGAGGRFDLFAVHADTGATRRLTSGGGSNEEPSFSPDGRYLVFTRARRTSDGEVKQLYVMAATGGPVRRVSASEELHFTPAWGPPPPPPKSQRRAPLEEAP